MEHWSKTFEELVTSSMSPLLDAYAFDLMTTEKFSVTFRRSGLFLMFTYDYRDGLVDVKLQDRRYTKGPPLILDDLCIWAGVKKLGMERSTEDAVSRGLEWIGKFLSERCKGLLLGDAHDWTSASELTRQRSLSYSIAMDLSRIRQVIPDLQQKRDYAAIVKALTPVQDHISPAERKLLEIARRRLPRR